MKPQLVQSKNTMPLALTDADRERAYLRCQEEIVTLSESIESQRRHMETLVFDSSDDADQSSVFEERQITLAELQRMGQRFIVLKQAIAKNPHDLGACECCGVDIDPGRLEIDPASDSCVDCKELEESRNLRNHGTYSLAM